MTDRATTPEDLLRFLYLMPVGVAQFRADGRVDLINPVASALLLSIATDASLHDMYLALAPIAPDLRQRVAAFGARSGCIVARPRLQATAGEVAIVLSLNVTRVDADLYMAVLAATGGVLAIALAIGLPIWMTAHGQPSTPAFHLFACWGIFALGGAYGCLNTYFLTDPPPRRPPDGGMPITRLHPASPIAAARPSIPATDDIAA